MGNRAAGNRRGERGQTILLVAISLLSLLAMAALAIDVVTLYVAKSEIQRAADAAALAGAKAIADSGITSTPFDDPQVAQVKTLAQLMAGAAIQAVVSSPANLVAGSQPIWSGPATIHYQSDSNLTNNPWITVTLQSGSLPIFFARIWSQRATVSASATAEAYNPANMPSFTPIAPRCVKPWLIANNDSSNGGALFVTPATGVTEQDAIRHSFTLRGDCDSTKAPACVTIEKPGYSGNQVDFVPALVATNTGNVCPAACQGVTSYQCSIACCDMSTTYNCGGAGPNANWDPTVYPRGSLGYNVSGIETLIQASGTGPGPQGQDLLFDPGPWPNAPLHILAQSGPLNGSVVTASSSVVTIPIIDPATFSNGCASQPCPVTIVGFLQAFINYVGPDGQVNVTVLNVVGCSQTPNLAVTSPVVGGTGSSPIPVRLISPP